MFETIFGLLLQALHACINGLRECSCADSAGVGMLIEVGLEAILLEKCLIVRHIVGVGIERLVLETIDEQTPPLVARAEVDRAVHRLHTILGEPLACRIEERKGHLAVVDRLEETTTARRLLVVEHCGFAVEKCCDATYALALLVDSQPATRLATIERVVAHRVEHRTNVIIERADPLRRSFVQPFRQVEELALVAWRADNLQSIAHNCGIFLKNLSKYSDYFLLLSA